MKRLDIKQLNDKWTVLYDSKANKILLMRFNYARQFNVFKAYKRNKLGQTEMLGTFRGRPRLKDYIYFIGEY